MAFDMGFNFRSTAGFVTDPSYAVPVLVETYPHTYTNGDGKSLNGGWVSALAFAQDESTSPDVRLAGINYVFVSTGADMFRVDLSSGSAPGAGNYTVDIAAGQWSQGRTLEYELRDSATPVITGVEKTTAANEFVDATQTIRSPGTSSWDLVRVTADVTFSTTTVNLALIITSVFSMVAHFRLTLQGAAADVIQQHIARAIGRGFFVGR